VSNFISCFLNLVKDYESPSSFWKWGAYATIAAVLRDNVYRRQGASYIYPNIYVLLLADSSVHRKGKPVDTSEILISSINNTKLITGSTSIQAMIDELARVESDAKTGKLHKSGSGIFLAQELSAALVEDPRAIKILTDIYDYKPMGYSVRLVSRANAKIDKLVLSMFAASNEALLRDLYNNTAIYGGLLARTFLVLPDEFRKSNSLWDEKPKDEFKECISYLQKIAELKGEILFEQDAMNEYDNWYKPFRESYRNKNEKSGVVGRIHTGVMKIAMLLAANELTLVIKKHHIEMAITDCMNLLPNYRTFLMTTGGSKNKEEIGSFILETMIKAKDHKFSRKQFLQQPIFIQPEGGELLDKMMTTLEAGGIVQSLTVTGQDTHWQLTPRGVEILEGKN
jgi:hypothetical protein